MCGGGSGSTMAVAGRSVVAVARWRWPGVRWGLWLGGGGRVRGGGCGSVAVAGCAVVAAARRRACQCFVWAVVVDATGAGVGP
jgi:hypothetical protein